jgi:pyruvate kinase
MSIYIFCFCTLPFLAVKKVFTALLVYLIQVNIIIKLRPSVPIIAVTYDIFTARWLAMAWGIYPIVLEKPVAGEVYSLSDEITKACKRAVALGFADPSDVFTVTAGLPFGLSGTTNLLRVVSAAGAEIAPAIDKV